jgi:hypothetical protein
MSARHGTPGLQTMRNRFGVRRALCERANGLRIISGDASKGGWQGRAGRLAGRDAA